MKRHHIIFFAMLAASAFSGCKTQIPTEAASYYSYETTCLGTEADGSQTLVAWGQGRNETDAVEQAKKNALNEVIFKGIHSGSKECDQMPLVNTPNARKRYQEYFDIFFLDGGEYQKYVSMADEKPKSRHMQHNAYGQKTSVTVRVLRSELKKRLQDDGILPK